MTDPTWHVYRDGGRWTVTAPDLLTAVDAARLQTRPGSWRLPKPERYVAVGTTWEAGVEAPTVAEILPTVLRVESDGFGNGLGVLCVFDLVEEGVVIERRAKVSLDVALRVACRGAAKWRRMATTPKRHVGVELYRSGKRAGQPRFTRAHGAETRARVLDAMTFNAVLERHIEQLRSYLSASLEVLRGVGLVERAEMETRAQVDAYEQRLEALLVDLPHDESTARAWCEQDIAWCGRQRERLASVEAYGFGPTSRCMVEPDPNAGPDEPQPRNPCVVTGVRVARYTRAFFGSEHERVHERVVEDADGREWQVSVARLRDCS